MKRYQICRLCVQNFALNQNQIKCDHEVEHCSDCGVCVEKLDHHCAFFDRCIAKNNVKRFYAVLAMFFGTMIFTVISLVSSKA